MTPIALRKRKNAHALLAYLCRFTSGDGLAELQQHALSAGGAPGATRKRWPSKKRHSYGKGRGFMQALSSLPLSQPLLHQLQGERSSASGRLVSLPPAAAQGQGGSPPRLSSDHHHSAGQRGSSSGGGLGLLSRLRRASADGFAALAYVRGYRQQAAAPAVTMPGLAATGGSSSGGRRERTASVPGEVRTLSVRRVQRSVPSVAGSQRLPSSSLGHQQVQVMVAGSATTAGGSASGPASGPASGLASGLA